MVNPRLEFNCHIGDMMDSTYILASLCFNGLLNFLVATFTNS